MYVCRYVFVFIYLGNIVNMNHDRVILAPGVASVHIRRRISRIQIRETRALTMHARCTLDIHTQSLSLSHSKYGNVSNVTFNICSFPLSFSFLLINRFTNLPFSFYEYKFEKEIIFMEFLKWKREIFVLYV